MSRPFQDQWFDEVNKRVGWLGWTHKEEVSWKEGQSQTFFRAQKKPKILAVAPNGFPAILPANEYMPLFR